MILLREGPNGRFELFGIIIFLDWFQESCLGHGLSMNMNL